MNRGSTYAVRFTLPKEYQAVFGRKDIVRSLGSGLIANR
ncbi:DUF6538 domain-containing protein [Maritimibacter sp. 55A14]